MVPGGALTCFIAILYNFPPIQQQLGSPNPKGQLGDSGLTKAKHNVESLEGSPGDARGSMASEEGEALGPPGDVCIGSQEAVGYNDSGDMVQ